MARQVAFFFASLLLAGCNPAEPIAGWDYKDCRLMLREMPEYVELGGSRRLATINRCMADKGLRPSSKCNAAGAQGKPHCEYEPAPQIAAFRW